MSLEKRVCIPPTTSHSLKNLTAFYFCLLVNKALMFFDFTDLILEWLYARKLENECFGSV